MLPSHQWKKDVEGTWRMDINVGIVEGDDIKKQEGVCVIGLDLNVDISK